MKTLIKLCLISIAMLSVSGCSDVGDKLAAKPANTLPVAVEKELPKPVIALIACEEGFPTLQATAVLKLYFNSTNIKVLTPSGKSYTLPVNRCYIEWRD